MFSVKMQILPVNANKSIVIEEELIMTNGLFPGPRFATHMDLVQVKTIMI